MENFQRNRLKPMAYGLILVSMAAVAVPAGQTLLMPESIIPTTPSQTMTTTPERPTVSLDGMLVDTIPQPHTTIPDRLHIVTPDHPHTATKAVA